MWFQYVWLVRKSRPHFSEVVRIAARNTSTSHTLLPAQYWCFEMYDSLISSEDIWGFDGSPCLLLWNQIIIYSLVILFISLKTRMFKWYAVAHLHWVKAYSRLLKSITCFHLLCSLFSSSTRISRLFGRRPSTFILPYLSL